jgi:hypothetical protein
MPCAMPMLRRYDGGGMLAIDSKALADAPLGSRWRCGHDVATLRGIMVWDGPDDDVWRMRLALAMLDIEGGARRTVSWTWHRGDTRELGMAFGSAYGSSAMPTAGSSRNTTVAR